MLDSTRVYALGICTGVGIALTLLAIAARVGFLTDASLLDFGCLASGVCLLLTSSVMWVRYKSARSTPAPRSPT